MPAAQVDADGDQRFFHRQREVAVAADALLVAHRLPQGLSQADADIFDRVMLVDVQVALGLARQIQRRRAGRTAPAYGPGIPRRCRISTSRVRRGRVQTECPFRPSCRSILAVRGMVTPSLSAEVRQASICSSVPTLIRKPSPQPG